MNFTDKQKDLLLSLETEQKYGYRAEDLSYGSPRYIIHKCDVCGLPKETPHRMFLKGKLLAHRHCEGVKAKQTNLKKYGVEHPLQCPEIYQKTKETLFKRYGVKSPFQCMDFREKAKKTSLQKYGTDNPSKLPAMQEKRKQTNMRKYGVEYAGQLPIFKEKIKQTNIKKYGVEHPLLSSEIKEKAKQTLLKHYGVEHAVQSSIIQAKIRQTNLEKYGTEHPWLTIEGQEERQQIFLKKYGVKHPAQRLQNRNKLREWCIQNPQKMFAPKSEIALLEWIRQYYPEAKKHRDNKYEIDVFIPGISVGIEHNGLFYHQESRIGRDYHVNKTKHFKQKGIRIIHIFEHEWKYRQEQVKSFLLSAIGKNLYHIGARKCAFEWLDTTIDIKEAHQFLENYHIQGASINTKYVVRVLYNNNLIGVATFGKHHRNNKDWVLTRFCTKTNYTIQGGLSKISKIASNKLKEDIISWADYRLSQGNGYEKAGWKFEELLQPDYFYHNGNNKVFSKQSRQKSVVKTPEGMTEKQHAEQDGLHRIYDCGKIRYRFKVRAI